MPVARAPTLIFRNWPSNVPTFWKMSAASASPGIINPIRHTAKMDFLTMFSFPLVCISG
jgi:hypothetical protein